MLFILECYLRLESGENCLSTMDSKTLTTLFIVIVCILLLPLAIGIIGGVFGLIGTIIGGVFGLIGGLFGAVFGIIGSVFGAVFGFIGWLFGEPFHWHGPDFFDGDIFAIVVVVLVVVMISRARRTRQGKSS